MARKLPGTAIQAGTINITQLSTTVVTNITTGGGPKVTSITYPNSATAAVNTGNQSIVLTGTGFESGVQVYVNGSAVPAVSRANANSLSFTTPALSTGATYPLYVVNPDGGTAVFVPGMVVSAGPVWVTNSNLTSWAAGAALSRNLEATSDSTVSYSLDVGSSLPGGLSLAANGLLGGTLASTPASETTYNFTVVATDLELQKSSKAFNITATLPPAFTISPAVNGITTWDLQSDGALSLSTAGTWNITPLTALTANVKIWGAGGGGTNGGGGGAAVATITFDPTKTYTLRVGANGVTGGGSTGGGGGGGTGIHNGTTHVLIAGGGGGGTNVSGGGGGGTSGAAGGRDFADGFGGGGGTQSAAGGGGVGRSNYNGAGGSGPGSITGGNGGVGGNRPDNGGVIPNTGGIGYGNGGNAGANYGDVGGSGGGGGYYGGGGGGSGGAGGGGGGGGSGFASPSLTSSATLYSASGNTAGNASDSNRGTSGNSLTAGKIYISI